MRPAIAILTLAMLAGCSPSTDTNDAAANAAANEPVDAPLTPAPAASTAPDAATLGQAIAASIDGGLGDNAKLLSATVDLDGDGTLEALGYLIDPMFCGTGGCDLYVLGQKDGKWTVLGEIGPSQLPIYKLPTATGGWADLGVRVAGGGMKAALMKVPHGADGYAPNPTVPPATTTTADGATQLIADDYEKAVPLGKTAQ